MRGKSNGIDLLKAILFDLPYQYKEAKFTKAIYKGKQICSGCYEELALDNSNLCRCCKEAEE